MAQCNRAYWVVSWITSGRRSSSSERNRNRTATTDHSCTLGLAPDPSTQQCLRRTGSTSGDGSRSCWPKKRGSAIRSSLVRGSTGSFGPVLDLRPRPDECCPQVRDRCWEIGVPASPRVHRLRLCEPKAISDLGRSNEILDVHTFWHGVQSLVAHVRSRVYSSGYKRTRHL